MIEPHFTIVDYETFSEADLKKVGPWEYSRHPSTEILCLGFKRGTRSELKSGKARTRYWAPGMVGKPETLFRDQNTTFVAHNAFFEQAITCNVLKVAIPPRRWICTAALAATHALPRKLGDANAALGLEHQKDGDGHRLMLKLSKPRKPSKHNPATRWIDPKELARLYRYCIQDVDAETDLFLTLPPLSEFERALWVLDQEINLRGVQVDLDLVERAIEMRDREFAHLQKELFDITESTVRSTAQVAALLEWLRAWKVPLPDLQAKTVSDALKNCKAFARPEALRALEIRQEASKTSTKKYAAFAHRTSDDGRLRGSLVYHAASTGRWAGSGIQPQNFPRGVKGINGATAAELVREGDIELIRLLYGSPMDVLSTTLRPCIIAKPGSRLVGGDFNAIELRVLFWIAKHDAGLRAIIENRQMYREMAEEIYAIKIAKDEGPEREVGKRAILGCGFGMGSRKFGETCEAFGQPITNELAKRAVDAYRSLHRPVPVLWSNLEKAAIYATQKKGTKVKINRTTWWVEGRYLYCELPSKRRLAYMDPSIKYEPTPWGESRPKLYHFGVHPKTKQWVNSATWGGVLTENVVQATARDLMAYAMKRIEAAGYSIVLTVHDEVLTEAPLGFGSVAEFEKIMGAVPEWAAGCPVKVKGTEGSRYTK